MLFVVLLISSIFSVFNYEVNEISDALMHEINSNVKNVSSLLEDLITITSNNNNNQNQNILTAITIIASVGTSLAMVRLQDWIRSQSIISKSHSSISDEINDIISSLTVTDTTNAINTLINRDPDPIKQHFPIDFYEGIIHSAYYLHLDKDTRNLISKFYNLVKLHNQGIIYLESLADQYMMTFTAIPTSDILLHRKNRNLVNLEGNILAIGYECLFQMEKTQ